VNANIFPLLGREPIKHLVIQIYEGLKHLRTSPGVSRVIFACKSACGSGSSSETIHTE
jgi:hypothetical protein